MKLNEFLTALHDSAICFRWSVTHEIRATTAHGFVLHCCPITALVFATMHQHLSQREWRAAASLLDMPPKLAYAIMRAADNSSLAKYQKLRKLIIKAVSESTPNVNAWKESL